MADLFQRDRSVIGKHIRNIFKEGELQKESVWAKFAYTAADGKVYDVDYYNLDVIISVGYRVKSKRGTQFRIWATGILAVLSSLLMAFAPGLFLICAAMGLNALSSTMFSGTDAALTYDSLKQAGQEERYLSVAANRSQIGMLASALGFLAAGRCGLRGRYRDRPTAGTSPHPAAVLHGVCPAGRRRDLSGRRGACMGRHSGHDAGTGHAGSLAAPCRPASQCPDLQ